MATTRFGSAPDRTSGRAAKTGILVASTIIPQTFAPSLVPRSWTDQGIVTGLATSLDYLATVITGDVLDATASAVATRLPLSRSAAPDEQRRVAQLIVDSTVALGGRRRAATLGSAAERAGHPRAGPASDVARHQNGCRGAAAVGGTVRSRAPGSSGQRHRPDRPLPRGDPRRASARGRARPDRPAGGRCAGPPGLPRRRSRRWPHRVP